MIALFEAQATVGIILMIVGCGLLVLEMLIPGFGLPGITGALAVLTGVLFYAQSIGQALLILLVIAVVLLLLFILVVRSVAKGRLSRSPIILNDAAKGNAAYDETLLSEDLLGRTGKTVSLLRPSGIAEFHGLRLDVVSDGAYLPAGTPVRIMRIQGRQVIVEPVTNVSE
jgi:membrane-bound ClpP family serine protease